MKKSRLSFLPAVLMSAFCALAVPVTAEPSANANKEILVELFSSQSCGNCPEANEHLIQLDEVSNIFPLVWSVSYWEYTGVAEPYAAPEMLARQKAYAERFELRGPYTPQVVIDGCTQNSGLSEPEVLKKIATVRLHRKPELSLSFVGGNVMVSGEKAAQPSEVWLVGYIPGITELEPEEGKNAGRSLRHLHLATSLTKLGSWNGVEPESFAMKCDSPACVVLVQETTSGEILEFGRVPAVTG